MCNMEGCNHSAYKQETNPVIRQCVMYLCQDFCQVAGGFQLNGGLLDARVLHVHPVVDQYTHEGTQQTRAPQDGSRICWSP